MTQVVPILRVADVDASLTWWQQLGFSHDFTHRYGAGTTHRFMGIRRDGADMFLSENRADATSPALVFVWGARRGRHRAAPRCHGRPTPVGP